jgi:hypothetical protein
VLTVSGRVFRVGLLLDSSALPRWAHRIVAELATSEAVRLVLAVRNATPTAPPRWTRASVFRAYEALDRRVFRAPNDYAEPVDAEPLLDHCENVLVMPLRRDGCDELAPDDVDAIRARDLDVLIQLGFGPLTGGVLEAARHGIWVFAHDDLERRGIPPLCREVMCGELVTETRLEAHLPGGRRTLYRSFSSTERNSLYRNRNAAYWKSSAFVTRALRELETRGQVGEPTASGPEVVRVLGPLATVRFAARRVLRILRNRARARRECCEWFIALRHGGGDATWCTERPSGFDAIPNPPGKYRADPFFASSKGATWLFFEEADVATDKGSLLCMRIAGDGTCGAAQVVLERDHHLSYPHVFEWKGAYFMIPESAEARTIELYRAVEFPLRWTLEKVLFRDVYAVDTTVIEANGRLWLFTAMSATGGSADDELFLFHADAPHGPWVPHPQNPIVSDVRHARPAGRIFREGGALVRPAQDCSREYGGAITLHRIDVLNEHEYLETSVGRIDPDWAPGLVATHTIDVDGALAVIDGRRWVRRSV